MKRRNFLKKTTGLGFGVVAAKFLPTNISIPRKVKAKTPIVLCSRGETWGTKVNTPAWDVLKTGGSALDAAEKGANVVELDPDDTSVGYGGLPNEEGTVQLDSSIMWGPTRNAGSVAGLEGIKTPCSVARLVMERTDHVMLVGEGAQRFAIAHGFKVENLLTEKARKRWLRWKENLSDDDDWLPPAEESTEMGEEDYYYFDRKYGTINVLAVDSNKHIGGITTTSGLAYKIPGRIGDSPVIGAGLYLDEDVGAAGAAGRGEAVIKTCGSFLIVENMRRGMSPQEACEDAAKRISKYNNGNPQFNVKYVALNKDGEHGCSSIRGNKEYPPRYAIQTDDGFKAFAGNYLFEYKR